MCLLSWHTVGGRMVRAGRGFITGLASHGIKAIAAPLPLTDLADDVLRLSTARLSVHPGPVVLAGHAYSGAVIGPGPLRARRAREGAGLRQFICPG